MRPLLLLLLATATQAQSPADTTRLDSLRTVTVTATRLPGPLPQSPLAATRLDSAYVRSAQPQLTLAESLGAVPGLFVLDDANFAQDLRIAIRGFGARAAFGIRGVKLLLDGIPESAPDGQAQVDNLDMSTVHRIEVLRGASGGLYGNASGGVVSLHSDPPPATPFAELRLGGGSFGFRQLHASGGAPLGRSSLVFSLTHLGTDGYRAHAALRSTLAAAHWHWLPDTATRFVLRLQYSDSPRADDPGALDAHQVAADRRAANPNNLRFDAGESLRQGRVAAVFEKKWTARQRLLLRAYATGRDFENRLPLQNGGQVTLERWVAGGGGQYEWAGQRLRGAAGFDFDRQADTRRRFDNLDGQRGPQNLDQLEVFSGLGAYLLAEWSPLPSFTWSGGLRTDWVQLRADDRFEADGLQSGSQNFRPFSPWTGMGWRLHPRLHAYANATTNFETPTLNELSNNPAGTGGFNAGLRPQRAVSVEAGLRGQFPAPLAWEVALFQIWVRDELTPYELQGFPGRAFYRNAGQTTRRGLEVSATWAAARGLQVLLAYTAALFRYEKFETPAGDFSGKNLPGLPQHWGQAELRYGHRSGVFAYGQLRSVGRFFADDGNVQAVKPWLLASARLGYRRPFQNFSSEIFLGVDNAAGVAYFNNIRLNATGGRYFEPGARQFFFAGLQVAIRKKPSENP